MENKKEEIRALIFDLGGVLQIKEKQRKTQNQKHSSGIHEKAAKKLGITLDQYFDAMDTLYALSIEGKISKKELLKKLSFNLNSTPKKLEKLFYNLYKKEFVLNKQLFKQVKILKKKGYVVAILSDQWHLSKDVHFSKKLQEVFSPAIISCDIGLRKPNPKVYKLILKKLKLKPEQTIFIDNQIWNIVPAKKLGMKTILFKNNFQLFKDKLWISLLK